MLCECGCGRETSIAAMTSARYGHVKGEPVRYIRGHHRRAPLADRLAAKTVDGASPAHAPELGPCEVWTGGQNGRGYGVIGRADRRGMMYAHRAVYELTHGSIPEGLELDHLCRNRSCVNPAHLEAVTHRENLLRGIAARKAAR